MSKIILVNIFGWSGVVALLAAYLFVSTRKLEGDSIPYQALNLGGSALLIVNSFYFGALPSVGVNAVWICIALFALIRKLQRLRKGQLSKP
jgi:hypothetical protein